MTGIWRGRQYGYRTKKHYLRMRQFIWGQTTATNKVHQQSRCKLVSFHQFWKPLKATRRNATWSHWLKLATMSNQQLRLHTKDKKECLGPLCEWAVKRCKEPLFWEFLGEETGDLVDSEASAKEMLCFLCTVDSRKELDPDSDFADFFKRRTMNPWNQWLKDRGVHGWESPLCQRKRDWGREEYDIGGFLSLHSLMNAIRYYFERE